MKEYSLSEYAKHHKVTYRTAWNRYKKGKIKNCFINETNHIIIKEEELIDYKKVALYARVPNNDRKDNLDRQLERITNFAINNGYTIIYSVKEIGSGLNDNRKKLIKLLNEDDWNVLIVENKDRLTRFGFNYIEELLKKQNKKIIVINQTEDDKTDLIEDLVSIIYSFSARLYGLRKKKNKEEIIKFLEE